MILPRYPKVGEFILYKRKLLNGKTLAICKVLKRDPEDREFDKIQGCRSYIIEPIIDSHPSLHNTWHGINVWVKTHENVESEISTNLEYLLDKYMLESL